MEKNKGAQESRTLESCPVAAEDIGFPFAAQAAQLTRQRARRKDETVGLITDLSTEELSPLRWLQANRQGWGIENGTHQRLDVSLNDDRCRVRSTNGLWILGMVRRFGHQPLHGMARAPAKAPLPIAHRLSGRYGGRQFGQSSGFRHPPPPHTLISLHAYALAWAQFHRFCLD